MHSSPELLLIDDDTGITASLQQVFGDEGYTVTIAASGEDGLRLAGEHSFDVVLTDVRLPGIDGLELVNRLRRTQPRLPIIVMTAHGTTDTAIAATKRGAYDYLLKPFEIPELLEILARAVRSHRLMAAPVSLGGESTQDKDAIIGSSRPMQAIFKEIGRIAARPVPVLIRGETGTGKELIARAIYQHSDRASQPFIAINCAAIPETLLESELFGHERGAFTGAEQRRIGRFEQADGGTLFLDEIGDLTPGTQAKLLRVLQEKTIQRVGGKESILVNVRVLAATHHDLEVAVTTKAFREDLLYRLNVVTLTLPPLSQRRDDIAALVAYFLRRHGHDLGVEEPAIQVDGLAALERHAWPGNVRELENAVRRTLLISQGYPIGADTVSEAVAPAAKLSSSNDSASPLPEQIAHWLETARRGECTDVYRRTMASAERMLLTQALALAGGNLTRVAEWLGISRVTLREKAIAYGLRARATDADLPGE